MEFLKTYEDCYVSLKENILTVGNNRMERSWDMKGGIPLSLSLKNKNTNKEWFSDKNPNRWMSVDSAVFDITKSSKMIHCSVETHVDDDLGFAVRHFIVDVVFDYDQAKVKWRHILYPDLPILRTCISCEGKEPIQEDYLDLLPSLPLYCKWKAVSFRDATDRHNNLVSTEEGLFYGNEKSLLSGNLLFVKDLLSEDGFLAIKEGPTPIAYQGDVTHDFEICGNNILTVGWGFFEEEKKKVRPLNPYGSAIVLWEGSGEDALMSLQQYHRAIHKYVPERDAFVMCNTWGDRSKSIKINEDFINRELCKAKQLGISCYQIDYGWQEAVAAISPTQGGVEGYYDANPNYWNVNKQDFPEGLHSIAEKAKNSKINLGLWFSPDSSNDFCNWEKDAKVLIGLYREYGIKAFKLDSVHIRSKQGEENLFRMMRKVVQETGGNVILNLDITAQIRNGYFGRVQYTSFFLENRYTDWHNYYPHWTLRNLWMLSKYYPTFRLQMEFLNVNRNKDLYKGEPLVPSACGIEYAFAVTMFSNPLAWMTLTGLDDESMRILERVIPVYRNYQSDILSGSIFPIGAEPSGTGWTGFQSITGEGKGFLLVIKEYNNINRHTYTLWKIKNKELRLHKLMGQGEDRTVKTDEEGRVDFCLSGSFQYVLYAYEDSAVKNRVAVK